MTSILRWFLSRLAVKERYGVTVWDQVGYEGAARSAWNDLERRDMNVLVWDFAGAPEPLVMVFARRHRAADVRERLSDILCEQPRAFPQPAEERVVSREANGPWFDSLRAEIVAMREQALSDYRDCREEGSHADAARYDCVASCYGTVLHMLDLRAAGSQEPT